MEFAFSRIGLNVNDQAAFFVEGRHGLSKILAAVGGLALNIELSVGIDRELHSEAESAEQGSARLDVGHVEIRAVGDDEVEGASDLKAVHDHHPLDHRRHNAEPCCLEGGVNCCHVIDKGGRNLGHVDP